MLKKYFNKSKIEAGCDEAGRGCLSGPVVAAAVIMPKRFSNKYFNDSKKLSQKKRYELRKVVKEKALAWGVGFVSPIEIDEINILNASFLAMHRAIDQLKVRPELLLIDGNRFNAYKGIDHECIVKGDAKYQSIAAASILAKTYRDDYMFQLAEKYPDYDWQKNKGYPTLYHRTMVYNIGLTPHHRKTFCEKILASNKPPQKSKPID